MAEEFDVLIVGAGMVGAAIAAALGQTGMCVGICDLAHPQAYAAEQPLDIRVSALSETSCTILQQLGAWDYIKAMRSCPYRRMAVWEKLTPPLSSEPLESRFNQTLFDSKTIEHPQLGFIVENRITQLALHQVLAKTPKIKLFCPVSIESIDFLKPQPVIRLQDGRTLTAPLVIGADGANSQVRQWAGIGTLESDYGQHALVATVEIAGGQQDITWQAFTATGPEAFLPLPDHQGKSWGSLVWYHQPDQVQRLARLSADEFQQEVQRTFPEELANIVAVQERASFPLTRRHANRYVGGGVALAGDAAHTINPLAGQGVNLGFQDAAWLAEILVKAWRNHEDWGSEKVLRRYEQIRQPENRKMQRLMDLFYYSFSNNIVPLKLARNLGLALAGRFKPGQKQVIRYATGLAGNQPKLARGVLL